MPKQIQVVGSNLYRIAADQLGDATQWVRIAELNGISDPFLNGPTSLLIPSIDPTQTGGLPAMPTLFPTLPPTVPYPAVFALAPTPTPTPTVPTPTPTPTGPTPTPTPTGPTPTPTPTPTTPTPTPTGVPYTYDLLDGTTAVIQIIVPQGADIESTNVQWPLSALDGVLIDESNNPLVDDAGNYLDATSEEDNIAGSDANVCVDESGNDLIDENGNFLDDGDTSDTVTYLVDGVGNQLVDESGNDLIDGATDVVATPDLIIDEAGNFLVDQSTNFLEA